MLNRVHVGGKGSDVGGSDLVAKERDRRLENVKELCEMGKMLGEVGAGHEDVVQVDKEEGESVENVVH